MTRGYAKVRKMKGKSMLIDNRQHLRWMADEAVKYRACAHFAFLNVAPLGVSEQGWEAASRGTKAEAYLHKDQQEAEVLLRILTPVLKAKCSLWSTWSLRECMESLSGVNYCENNEDEGLLNLTKAFRDSNVKGIWDLEYSC